MTSAPIPTTPTFRIRVSANAAENSISFKDGRYLVRIAAPAEKNKANRELLRVLGKWLKRPVRIRSGLSSKEKVIALR